MYKNYIYYIFFIPCIQRGDRLRPEDQVLMRALRDFNIPKIVTDDTPVFMGLIGDLFPALDVPRKRDFDFEKSLVDGAISMNLQPEPGFILKVKQMRLWDTLRIVMDEFYKWYLFLRDFSLFRWYN